MLEFERIGARILKRFVKFLSELRQFGLKTWGEEGEGLGQGRDRGGFAVLQAAFPSVVTLGHL